jgi:hypothetical protein
MCMDEISTGLDAGTKLFCLLVTNRELLRQQP